MLFRKDNKELKTISKISNQQTIVAKAAILALESAAARVEKVLTSKSDASRSDTNSTSVAYTMAIITTERIDIASTAELSNFNVTTQRLPTLPEMRTQDASLNIRATTVGNDLKMTKENLTTKIVDDIVDNEFQKPKDESSMKSHESNALYTSPDMMELSGEGELADLGMKESEFDSVTDTTSNAAVEFEANRVESDIQLFKYMELLSEGSGDESIESPLEEVKDGSGGEEYMLDLREEDFMVS